MGMKVQFILNAAQNTFDAFQTHCEQLAEAWNVPSKIMLKIILIIEELYTNSCKYGSLPGTKPQVTVSLERTDHEIEIIFTDSGPGFNPFQVPPQDREQPFEERTVGGLGIHLVRNLVDEYSYKRENGKNIVTLTITIQ